MFWNICKRPSRRSEDAWGESERIRLGENAPAIPVEESSHGIQTQIYRQVLLSAITELWVDYLTRVEAAAAYPSGWKRMPSQIRW